MARPNSRLRRCLWDALFPPLMFGTVVLVVTACNYLLERLV